MVDKELMRRFTSNIDIPREIRFKVTCLSQAIEGKLAIEKANNIDMATKVDIIDELDREWRKFCDMIVDGNPNPNMFSDMIDRHMPNVHRAWRAHKKNFVECGLIVIDCHHNFVNCDQPYYVFGSGLQIFLSSALIDVLERSHHPLYP